MAGAGDLETVLLASLVVVWQDDHPLDAGRFQLLDVLSRHLPAPPAFVVAGTPITRAGRHPSRPPR